MIRAANTAFRIGVNPSLPIALPSGLVGNAEVRAIVIGTQAGLYFLGNTPYVAAPAWQRVLAATMTPVDSGVLAGNAVTIPNVIPLGHLLLAVVAEVTVVITGSTTWDLGDNVDPVRYAAALPPGPVGVAANIETYGPLALGPLWNSNNAAITDLLITNDGFIAFTGGRITIRIYSLVFPWPV